MAQRPAEKNLVGLEAERAGVAHPAHRHLLRIVWRWDPGGQRSWRCLREAGWCLHAERFGGPLLCILVAKLVEPRLLGRHGGFRRMGGFRLERAVHARMTAVLFGPTGGDPLVGDPQLEPRPVQLGPPSDGPRREGHAVVGPDRLWEPVGGEQRAEDRHAPGLGQRGQSDAAEEVAPRPVGDRARIAGLAGAAPDLAREIRGPDLVRGRGGQGRTTRVRPAPPRPPRPDQAGARQPGAGGRGRAGRRAAATASASLWRMVLGARERSAMPSIPLSA